MITNNTSLKNIRRNLLSWFNKNRRPLPWRKDSGWYNVWISEIMLQQTQVQQVIPYYLRFIETFPGIHQLAGARQEKVLKTWEGLGYYSRARYLHRAAKLIVSRHNGHLPDNFDALSRLPGFGPYTTRAMLSIAFNQPYAVVDGNVIRVVTRLLAIGEDIRQIRTRTGIQNVMDRLIDKKSPGFFNQAMMELGATICLSTNPLCRQCPLKKYCRAFRSKTVEKYPYKSKIPAKPTRYALALLMRFNKKYLVAKRPTPGLLAGMWEFPIYPLTGAAKIKKINGKRLSRQLGLPGRLIRIYPEIAHSYSHFHLRLFPCLFQLDYALPRIGNYQKFRRLSWSMLPTLPMHRVMRKLISRIEGELIAVAEG